MKGMFWPYTMRMPIDLWWSASKNPAIKPPKFFGIMENCIGFAKAKPLKIY